MLIRSSLRIPAQFTMGKDVAGREYLSLVAKATYDFPAPGGTPRRSKQQEPLVLADEYTGAPGYSAPHQESDFAFRKGRCDVLARGTAAYAPGGQPAERVRVGLRVGDWVKQFDVVGPRQWRTLGPSIAATRPFPFTRLAFSYDTAFGGPDRSWEGDTPPVYLDNPVGLGFAAARSGSRIDGLDLPLTEAPGDPVTSPFGAHRPMALGPMGRAWPQRARHAGTYDDHWKENIFPFLPPDFDERYYQSAPEDQQIAPPAPGTPVVIVGLTPAGREEFRLPDTLLPVAVFRRREAALQTVLRPDTLTFDCEARRFTLCWRCEVPILRTIAEFPEAWVGPPSRGLALARAKGKPYLRLAPVRRDPAAEETA